MKTFPIRGRTLALFAIIIPLLVLFIYLGLRSGPLAPVAVIVANVESQEIKPTLFGIGTVETRYNYKIGPTFTGRINYLDVDVGDRVNVGQVLGEMDAIDLDDKVRSQDAAYKRAEAQLSEAKARHVYAKTQARRYEKLFAGRATSEESATTKRHELQIAAAALSVAQEDLARIGSDRAGLQAQRNSLRLIAPADGIITLRDADPGTTIVAGQAVVEIIDPTSLWVNVRFDQSSSTGLAAELPANVTLRSRSYQSLKGKVLRVEPKADVITEEILAKVVFDALPNPLPPIGELTEVTIDLPALKATPSISNASIRRNATKIGVWKIVDGDLVFAPVKLGATDLDGSVQVLEGLNVGDQIVIYSEKTLTTKSRFHVVDHIAGVSP